MRHRRALGQRQDDAARPLRRAGPGDERLASCWPAWRWTTLDEDARARVRNEHTGFVFQNFQLVPTLTALENVMVPAELRPGNAAARTASWPTPRPTSCGRSGSKTARGIIPRNSPAANSSAWRWPGRSSTGPRLLFADEPTGNLDAETSDRVVDLLLGLNSQAGTALVLVTHNPELAALTGRTIRLRDGAMVD